MMLFSNVSKQDHVIYCLAGDAYIVERVLCSAKNTVVLRQTNGSQSFFDLASI